MKAIQIHAFGGQEMLQYEDVERPQIKTGEVLVKVCASAVNPVDNKIRAGKSQEKFPAVFPLIMGWDLSGIVEETGQSVTKFKKGDEVYGRPYPGKNGAFAEYIAVKESEIAIKPKYISHEQAAGVPLTGLTAWEGLFDHGKLEKGQKVCILGASGGVAIFAVQLATWKGAEVTGTASAQHIDFIKQLGAAHAIDYTNEWPGEMYDSFDVVFDTVGGDTQQKAVKILKFGGRLITTVKPETVQLAKDKNITIESFTARSDAGILDKLSTLVEKKVLKIFVTDVYSLENAAEAEKAGEQKHAPGKIIVWVSGD